jgi:phosphotransferase system, enzyme I, PtsP
MVDAAEIGEAMKGWLANPPADLRSVLLEWAGKRGITFD